jgi:hypothetical protein
MRTVSQFWWYNLKGNDHLENRNVDGVIILKWILKKCNGWVWTIYLAEDRDQRAVVIAVPILRVS